MSFYELSFILLAVAVIAFFLYAYRQDMSDTKYTKGMGLEAPPPNVLDFKKEKINRVGDYLVPDNRHLKVLGGEETLYAPNYCSFSVLHDRNLECLESGIAPWIGPEGTQFRNELRRIYGWTEPDGGYSSPTWTETIRNGVRYVVVRTTRPLTREMEKTKFDGVWKPNIKK